MLNAREPKVINGPEILNKFVGQSEENVRKLFVDAEKEYKEKGEESGLHIIIFDELDAVCKQRGGGSTGGTGVGDSVVNQLLSKLDGVDQLNNILLIGMTNRMDMIDDALLRPGRLEVHMEISLPDEHGRQQILKIHTQKMRDSNHMASDVNLNELAHETKNFSGAEINGLIKSATSFAMQRHVKVGTMAGVSDDVVNMKVNREDFQHALEEVHPAFGVSEEELENRISGGIIHYNEHVQDILRDGRRMVDQARDEAKSTVSSILFHGPPGSGKTALAAKVAVDSEYPFIKMISTDDMLGMNEGAKIAHITKVFNDAYKSTLSLVVIDSIELILEWVGVGPRFSNSIFQTLVSLLRKKPPKGRKLLVLATTSKFSVLDLLEMTEHFNAKIAVPTLQSYQEVATVMNESRLFTQEDISRSLTEVKEITRSENVGVGIKNILFAVMTAKQDSDVAGRFASMLSEQINQSAAPNK